ncbi:symplekin isoform X1 [Pieris brassicae]|uniref:symplekin isoform X1 n=1 Tax=Pieris brassicae TaxID=7116 RepID=UPI001E6617AC|nr:symplekin isoform X1 [Pieris brassicae]
MSKPSTNINVEKQLIQWINEAGMSEGGKRAGFLRRIVEVLTHQLSAMIPMYMDNVLSFVNDKSTDIRKIVIGFIEELSTNFPYTLPKVISQLQLLVIDTVVAVQKRAIQAAGVIYKNVLTWISKEESVAEMKHVWEHITKTKLQILNMIDSENEGIRTHAIKFLEEVVLLQTANNSSDFSIDNIPNSLTFINHAALEEEAEHIFELLIKFHNSQHISSVNLMACMATLISLAKFRPKYLARVLHALGELHTTLPPTLSQSQVNSVRKHLKIQLINLVKHTSSNDMIPALMQLLSDIGMTQQEINKAIPKEKRHKRVLALATDSKNGDSPAKKSRMDSPPNSQESDSNSNSRTGFDDDSIQTSKANLVDEDSLFDGLNNLDNVLNLVMSTLLNNLPNEMPSNFINIYQPIPNAGTKTQIRSLAKMMHSVVKGESEIPLPVPTIVTKIPLLSEDDEKITLKNAVAKLQETTKDRQVENAVSKLMEEKRQEYLKEEERKAKEKQVPPQLPALPKLKQKVKLLKLQEITRPIPKEIKERLMLQAVKRILNAEKEAAIGGAAQIRAKFITIFASSYTPEIRDLVLNYVLEDPINRIDLALAWLYEEYAYMQGFNRHPVTLQKVNEKPDQNYNQLLCAMVTQICERGDPLMENSKEVLLRRIYCEAPVITSEALDYLKHLVVEEKSLLALELLEELCTMRPPRAHKYIPALVSQALNEVQEIRDIAIKSTVKIFKNGSDAVKKVIEKHSLLYLGFIALDNPPTELMSSRHNIRVWSDDLYKVCLNLVMALFMENDDFIIDVARVYGCAGSEAKRCVLRAIEGPLRAVAASAPGTVPPAFQILLQDCPRGAETLLTRLVHILTDKAPPTPELVSRVRELYATRVSDVRFLIPILNGLSKREILAALPKLVKLNPNVVKEVFNKLLGLQNPNNENLPEYTEIIFTPEELLVALHLIDPNKADLKFIIKATGLCFAEKQIYTQDVVSAVLQRLAEEPDTPVLMMRSVLQALTLYPNLGPLALNILQLLIDREVWTNKVAWEGWVKCCERLGTAVTRVLAALPARALPSLPPHLARLLEPQDVAPKFPPLPVPNPLEPLPPGME